MESGVSAGSGVAGPMVARHARWREKRSCRATSMATVNGGASQRRIPPLSADASSSVEFLLLLCVCVCDFVCFSSSSSSFSSFFFFLAVVVDCDLLQSL